MGVGKYFTKKSLTVIQEELRDILYGEAVFEVMEIIINDYQEMLIEPVQDNKCKTNPINYFEEFTERLSKFEYCIEKSNGGITFVTPDVWTFDYRGKLIPLQSILEGTFGTYVEVSVKDYELLYGESPSLLDLLYMGGDLDDIVFLVKYDKEIQEKEKKILKRKLVQFPFSNSMPIDIFKNANRHRKENINKWAVKAVKNAMAKIKKESDGGKII